MARFRLSTDILSPLNSDISLNDASAFSFGSLPGTPVFDINIASPIHSASAKDTDISPLFTKNMKECANAFDEITSDIKRQSSTNSEKEEKYKETYEMLKKSMDDLFGKESNASTPFPESENNTLENENIESKMRSEVTGLQDSKNLKVLKKNKCPSPEKNSEITEKKSEKCKKEKSVAKRPAKIQPQPKQTSSTLESVKSTKNKYEVIARNDAASNEKKDDALIDQKKNSKVTSKNDGTSCKTKGISSKKLPEKKKEKEAENVKKYDFKCQKKIPISNNVPIIQQKSLSIEKPIQLAVSMEMDNIRRLVQHQNLYMRKDLLKLQETVKKQNEVTEYLFTVIDELIDTNKKLISKIS